MGSRARVVLYAPDEGAAAAAAGAAFDEMERLNTVLSDYDPESEAMRLCRRAGQWTPVSPDLLDVLLKSREVWAASGGAFDPTVGPLSILWRDARRDGRIPDPDQIERARARVGMRHVGIDEAGARVRLALAGMRLDFGAIGKGYAADVALRTLAELGHAAALVELGGDKAIGRPPPDHVAWTITLESGAAPRTLAVSSCGVATSGPRYQFIEAGGVRYSHVLDPRTGYGLTDPTEVTVVAPTAWLADALASAASVVGPDGLERLRARYPQAEIIRHPPPGE